MGHYKSNVRDLEFNLFEVFNVQERLGKGVLAESDEETARGVLAELNRLATGPLAESFVDADRNPPTYDPKTFSATLRSGSRLNSWCTMPMPARWASRGP